MPTRILIAGNAGPRVYAAGRVGLDTGPDDVGGAYTALLKTERLSPAGEGGLVHFRRVLLRVLHTGTFTVTLRAYVDEVQTQVYVGSTLTDQEFTYTQTAPLVSPDESLIEVDIDAHGTFIQVELEVQSDEITGVFLPESLSIGARVLRPGRQREASTT
jgi:hypothetical protein